MTERTLASIDVGTNTFRLLIAVVNENSIKELYSERVITRIGSGISEDNILADHAIEIGVAALNRFRSAISDFGVEAVSAAGTSALRDAKNSDQFIRRAQEAAGIEIPVISGDEEAGLTALGALFDTPLSGTVLLTDVGGGSTELILLNKKQRVYSRSIPLGAVYLADTYMRHDPPSESDISSMRNEIREAIAFIKTRTEPIPPEAVFIGAGGTVTTLSAMVQGLMSFERSSIHQSRLPLQTITEISSALPRMTSETRAKEYPVLETARLDIIVPGAIILHTVMVTFGLKEVIVSDYGLTEGLLLQLYRRLESPPGVPGSGLNSDIR